MSVCPFIQPQNSLERDRHRLEIIDKIVSKITSFPEFRKYKIDLEMLTMVCLLVEHLVKPSKDKKKKVDKKQIVFDAYEKSFGNLTPTDLDYLNKNVEYLIDNGHIKKVNFFNRMGAHVSDWIFRKVIS